MRTHARLALAVLTAAIVLAAATGAQARRFEFSVQSMRAVWTGWKVMNAAGTTLIQCPATLEGTFHSRTISKVCGQLIGYITNAKIRPTESTCVFGGGVENIRFLNGGTGEGEELPASLPWHIRYFSFTGALPNIVGIKIQIVGLGYLIKETVLGTGVSCLYRSTVEEPLYAILTLEAGVVTGLKLDETRSIPIAPFQNQLCVLEVFNANTATVTQLNSTARITVRLVQ